MQRYLWGMTIILVLGFAVRVLNMDAVPPGLQHDELYIAEDSISIITEGNLRLFYDANQGREGLYIWLLSVVYVLVGKHIVMIKLLPWFTGLVTMALAYRVFGRIYSRAAGVLASLLIAFTFFFVFLNRVGLRANLMLPVVLLAIWQGYRLYGSADDSRRWRSAIWLGGLVATGLYIYTAAGALLLAIALFNIGLLLFDRATLRKTWQHTALIIVVSGLLALPMIITRLHSTAGLERISNVASPLQSAAAGDIAPLLTNAVSAFGMAAFSGDPEWRYNIAGRPFYTLPVGLLFYLGIGLGFFDEKQRRVHMLLVCIFCAGVLPAIVTDAAPAFLRSIVALPVIVAMMSYAVYRTTGLIAQKLLLPAEQQGRVMLAASVLVAGAVAATDTIALHRTWAHAPEILGIYRDDLEQLAHVAADADVPLIAASTFDDELDPRLYDYYRQDSQQADVIFFDGAYNIVLPRSGALLLLDSRLTPIQAPVIRAWLTDAQQRDDTITGEYLILNQNDEVIYESYSFTGSDTLHDGVSAQQVFYVDDRTPFTPAADLNTQTASQSYPLRFEDLIEITHIVIPRTQITNSQGRIDLYIHMHPLQSKVDRPAKLFAHLLNSDGELVAQRDFMGVHPLQWHRETTIVQAHFIPLAEPLLTGEYTIAVGLYDEQTGERYSIVADDETVLSDVTYVGKITVR